MAASYGLCHQRPLLYDAAFFLKNTMRLGSIDFIIYQDLIEQSNLPHCSLRKFPV
ncbi:hypothetical protein LDG_6980 [Legionella drancourtii LLAP12]|uniref:Uncharacterized protein n=1 Tax=Legionella drancourtii LLAP12 TaxID=658187 RepID=G9EP00_9GAMM|nr:hypothetical protein LDG_6980 [Legionella drancourtii LLAP12]